MSKSTNTSKGRGSGIAGNKRMHPELSGYELEEVHVSRGKTWKEDCFDDERTDPTFTPSCKRRKCAETSIKTQPRRAGLPRNPSTSKKSNTLLGSSSPVYNAFRQDWPCWSSRKRTRPPKAKEYDQEDAAHDMYSGKLNGDQYALITMKETTVRCPLAFLPEDHFNQKKRKGNTYLFLLCSLALSLENERCPKKQKVDSLAEENHLNNDDASLFSKAEWGAVEALYSMKAVTPIPDETIAAEPPFVMEAIEELPAPSTIPPNIPESYMPAESKIEPVASELQSTGAGLGFADATGSNITDTESLQKEKFKALLPCCNSGFQSSKFFTERFEPANELIPIAVASSESKPPKPRVFNLLRGRNKVASQEPQPPKPHIFKVYSSRSKVLRLERLCRRFNRGPLSNLS